eukprot:Sspe_Gene.78187::Locus_48903_Transcript_1_1_Confidence_1.000_Length_2139::g.78187::m.78187
MRLSPLPLNTAGATDPGTPRHHVHQQHPISPPEPRDADWRALQEMTAQAAAKKDRLLEFVQQQLRASEEAKAVADRLRGGSPRGSPGVARLKVQNSILTRTNAALTRRLSSQGLVDSPGHSVSPVPSPRKGQHTDSSPPAPGPLGEEAKDLFREMRELRAVLTHATTAQHCRMEWVAATGIDGTGQDDVLHQLKEESARLGKEVERWKGDCAGRSEELSRARQELAEAREKLLAKEEEAQKVKGEAEKLKAVAKQVYGELMRSRDEGAKKVGTLERQVERLREEKEELAEELAKVRAAKKREQDEYDAALERLRGDKRELVEEVERHKAARRDDAAVGSPTAKAVEALREEVKAMETLLADHKQDTKRLEAELTEALSESDELREKVKAAQADASKYERYLADAEEKMKKGLEHKVALTKEVKSLRSQLQEEKDKTIAAERKCQELEGVLAERDRALEAMREQRDRAALGNPALQEALVAVEQQLAEEVAAKEQAQMEAEQAIRRLRDAAKEWGAERAALMEGREPSGKTGEKEKPPSDGISTGTARMRGSPDLSVHSPLTLETTSLLSAHSPPASPPRFRTPISDGMDDDFLRVLGTDGTPYADASAPAI